MQNLREIPFLGRNGPACHATQIAMARSEQHDLRLLVMPTGAWRSAFPEGCVAVSSGETPDAVLVIGPHASEESIAVLLGELPAGHVLPVAWLGSDAPDWADAHADIATSGGLEHVLNIVAPIVRRMALLPEAVRLSREPEQLLLARTFVRNSALKAVRAPKLRETIRYSAAGLVPDPTRHAEALVSRGLLSRRFFDRVHVCPQCRSSRVNVREECPACRSANLEDVQIIHHFTCASEAPEASYQRGSKLVCPKCLKELRHIGLDYDKPATMLACRDCGKSADAPLIGFVCLDCEQHTQTEAMGVLDWFSYELTLAGESAAKSGLVSQQDSSSADEGFRALLKNTMREFDYYGTPFCLLQVNLTARSEIEDIHGSRLWHQIRALTFEVICGCVRPVDSICEQGDRFLLLLSRADANFAASIGQEILRRAAETFSEDPRLQVRVLGCEEAMVIAGDHVR